MYYGVPVKDEEPVVKKEISTADMTVMALAKKAMSYLQSELSDQMHMIRNLEDSARASAPVQKQPDHGFDLFKQVTQSFDQRQDVDTT